MSPVIFQLFLSHEGGQNGTVLANDIPVEVTVDLPGSVIGRVQLSSLAWLSLAPAYAACSLSCLLGTGAGQSEAPLWPRGKINPL